MIRISDDSLMEYFSSFTEGQELTRSEVAKHLSLYSFDFEGVTGEQDLQKFRVTSPGQITKKAGIVQSRIKLSPVFENPTLRGRKKLASKFSHSISQETYSRSKAAIEMQIIRQNGLNFKSDTHSLYQMMFKVDAKGNTRFMEGPGATRHGSSATDIYQTPFTLKKGSDNIRLTLPDASHDKLYGTDLYKELYTEVLMGAKTGLKFDSNTRSFIQSNQNIDTGASTVGNKKTGTYKPRKDDATNNETDFSRKLNNMWQSSTSMHLDDSQLIDDVISQMKFQDISRMESMDESAILKEFSDVEKMINGLSVPSSQDRKSLKREVIRRLGANASREDKKQLYKELIANRKQELVFDNIKAFKETAKMYATDRRDYLDPESRMVSAEDQWDDIYKESYYAKKAQEEQDKYIARVRSATHTQDADGNWVKNDLLPNRYADKIRQAISVDMNVSEGTDNLENSLIRTIELGKENLANAEASLPLEREKLKQQRLEYNELFKRYSAPKQSMAETDALIAEKVAGYKLWSRSVSHSMGWIDRKEIDYILDNNASDSAYYDTYLSAKKAEAFEFGSKTEMKLNQKIVDEHRKAIEEQIVEDGRKTSFLYESSRAKITEKADAIILEQVEQARENSRKAVFEILTETKELLNKLTTKNEEIVGRKDSKSKRAALQKNRNDQAAVIQRRENKIAEIIKTNFRGLEVGGVKPTGTKSMAHGVIPRLKKADELFATENNVSAESLFMSQETTKGVSEYMRLSSEVAELEKQRAALPEGSPDIEGLDATIENKKGSIGYVLYDLRLQDGIKEKTELDIIEAQIKAQEKLVSGLSNTIVNNGYSKEFGNTVHDKETGKLQHIGISREMYDIYVEDTSKLASDIKGMSEDSSFDRERKKVANRESWYRALGTGEIVKGHYNDERGYRVTDANPITNIAYLERPAVKVSDLQYTTDISNNELIQNIDKVDESITSRFNPSNKESANYDVLLSNFEDTSVGHVTLYADIPAIEYIEPEVSDMDMARYRQGITSYLNKDGAVRYNNLPKWATYQLDQFIYESDTRRLNVLDDIEKAKGVLEKAKATGVSPEVLAAEQAKLKAEQDRLTTVAKEKAAIRNEMTERILGEIKSKKINNIVKRNDRIKTEIELFGFKQGDDNARVEMSRDNLTKILIGDNNGSSKFYRNLINSHFPHLTNPKGNGTASLGDAILNVIDDHVVQQTEFDLRDEALSRKYMQSLDSTAMVPSDLSERNKEKLNKYVGSLGSKGMYDRLRDTLFSDIVQKTMEVEYGGKSGEFDGIGNTIKNIYDEMRQHYPESDITGQSMYSFIQNKDNEINAELKKTYQSRALKLSPNSIDTLLSQYKQMGVVSLDKLSESGQEAADIVDEAINDNIKKTLAKVQADELLASYEETFPSDGIEKRPSIGISESQYDKTSAFSSFIDTDIDTSDLKKTNLDKGWKDLIEKMPHMAKVQELVKRSSIKVKNGRDDAEGTHAKRAARLSLYAMGAMNNQEAKYQSVLRLEDTVDIFDGENLMNKALSNPSALSERQVSTTLELAESLNKKVNVRIPIGDDQFTEGYLRFNEANEVEAYSPSLKQSYVVNDAGKTNIATVRMDDMRAYGTDNRQRASKSYSKKQPILKQSIANEGQMKRGGNSLFISNVDASFGELVDFVEQGKVGISYDIETTMTNPNKLKHVVQPIEIYGQQIQVDKETGELYRDSKGNFAVKEETMESVFDEDGTERKVQGTRVVAKDYHAIMALEQPAIDLINKIGNDEDYFNISQSESKKIHIVDFISSSNLKNDGQTNVDFIQALLGKKMKKSKANALMSELTTKSEEYQFLNNVAKYKSGALKTEHDLERFGTYSNAKAVDTREGFLSHLKENDRTLYNTFINSDGSFNKDNTNHFDRILYEHQAAQTKVLVDDAKAAGVNLADKNFNYGDGVRRVSVAQGISDFVDFQRDSGSDVFFVQNGEIADNKTLVDSSKLIDERSNANTTLFNDGLRVEMDKIISVRNNLLQGEVQKFTEEYADKFGINPRAAAEQRQKSAEVLADPNRDKAGYLKSKNKVWVESLTEALEYLPELNRSNSNVRFTSEGLKETDKKLATYTSMIDKLTSRSGEFSPEEMSIAKKLDLFGGNEFSIANNTITVPKLEEKVQEMYDNAGVSDQQNISRVVNSELRSQSNASLMAAQKFNNELAHDGKVDTIFGSQNVGRFAKDVHSYLTGQDGGTKSPLGYVLNSLDSGSAEDGGFMERNSYKGDGTEHISFIEKPNEDIQKGVYRLMGFNEEGTMATLQRVVQGQDGVIVDTSVEPAVLKGETNAELAHMFARTVRNVPDAEVSDEIKNYRRDISTRHFDKILGHNLSYDSHMNQIREIEIENGMFRSQSNNPLFAIDDPGGRVNLLEASMDELIASASDGGSIHLKSNPVERAREAFANSITPMEELRHIIDTDSSLAVSDVDRSLIRNSHLLGDTSKEKFYNKEITKEQMLALQEINDFNHTGLGGQLADLMDNITALESQGHINDAEKANILSGWNEALKQKAEQSGHTYKVQNTAVIPEFMLNIKDKASDTTKTIPIQSNIQVSSPTEIANSLQGIAKKIGGLKEYSSAKDVVGLKEDYALNAEIVPHLKSLGVLSAEAIDDGAGGNRFLGLGELSHMVYNNLQANPELLERTTRVDHLKLAKNMSDEDVAFMGNKSTELLSKYFARQTDVHALQFEGLKESRNSLRHEGLYIPGMKLEAGEYSLDDVNDLKRYSTSSFLQQQSTSELVGMADQMAGSGSRADKQRTKLIYKEIMNRASTGNDGKKSIDPQTIIDSGNHGRIEAALAMNWIKPITQRETNTYVPNEDIQERRIGYGEFAGAKLGDIPESALDNQSYMAYRNMQLPSYGDDYARMPHLQQQEMIANWQDTGYKGHDHEIGNKYYTSRGEAPIAAEDLSAHNEQIKEEWGNKRRNETPGSLSTPDSDSIEGMVEQARSQTPTQHFANNEKIASQLNIHPSVSVEDVRAKSAQTLEIKDPIAAATSDLEDFISRKKADIGNTVSELVGSNGGKWVAGLGVAAAALFAVNSMNSPMKMETRPAGHGVQGVTGTPEDDTNRTNKQAESRASLNEPNHQNGGTSYVTSGEKGYTIKASGKAPSNIDSSQLQSTINNSMSGANGVNINLRDDRSTLDGSWLESQFSNFIERGSAGG